MFYGGKLLSHLSADLEYLQEELIPLFKINRNAFVIIDSDITSNKKEINKTKQRIKSEIGEQNCWITNYYRLASQLH